MRLNIIMLDCQITLVIGRVSRYRDNCPGNLIIFTNQSNQVVGMSPNGFVVQCCIVERLQRSI